MTVSKVIYRRLEYPSSQKKMIANDNISFTITIVYGNKY